MNVTRYNFLLTHRAEFESISNQKMLEGKREKKNAATTGRQAKLTDKKG